MLSAIAARKAAQAASGPPVSVSAPVPKPERPAEVPLPASRAPVLRAQSRPSTKRRSSSQGPNSSRKRKKKREAERKKTRYFQEEEEVDRDDILNIDSDDEEPESDFAPPLPPPVTRSTKRAWSPSDPVNDSSDEEGEELPSSYPISPPDRIAHVQTLTTLSVLPDKNTFYLEFEEIDALGLSADTTTLLGLSVGQTICLLGSYRFTVLQGSVSFCGVRMPAAATTHNVFAPRSSPIPILEALDEKEPSMSVRDVPARLRPAVENYSTLVAIQQLNSGAEDLGKICRPFDGVFKPSRWQQINDGDHELRIPGVHVVAQPSKDIQPFLLPPTWEAALDSLSDSASGVYFIKGHKKSGKSTFARTLLNRLLLRYRKVAFLECDLGQSEFTPGGLVALNIIGEPVFGPPFSHPTIPNFAHYVGTATPKSSPSHYLASIQALLETYQLDVQSPADTDLIEDGRITDAIPLIVNTMGWTKGLGADLTRKIEDMVQPTNIFEVEAPFFEQSVAFENPSQLSRPSESTKVHLLQPIVSSTNFSAADHRSIAILSYLHAIFPRTTAVGLEQITATTWNTALPLCAYPPYEVDWRLALDQVVLCGAGSEDVVPSEVNRVLNGALVGLVSCEPGSLESGMTVSGSDTDILPVPYAQGSAAPSPSTSACRGLALIRAVSPSSSHIRVLTPLPPHLLTDCRVLVKGELELPVWGMLDFRSDEGDVAGVEKGNVPYLQWGKGEGVGGERRRVRRNLMRKGQM